MPISSNRDFLQQLQQQAQKQARLHQQRWLPKQLDGVTSFIGRYPWQTSLVLSGLTAALMEIVKFL